MKTLFVLLLLLLPRFTNATTKDPACASLLPRGNSFLRTFLLEQNATRTSKCISAVIKSLGESRDTKAIHLLGQYLDYMDPETAPGPTGGADRRPEYPAINALFQIGKPAARELLAKIQSPNSQKTERNATLTYLFVYRDDLAEGIRNLKQQENVSQDPRRTRLAEAEKVLLDACKARGKPAEQECNVAAEK